MNKTLNEVKPVENMNKNPAFWENSYESLVDSNNFLEEVLFFL